MQVGDSVIFKRRVRDFWTSQFHVAGWQGRIHEIGYTGLTFKNGEKQLNYIIAYDSVSLQNMSEEYIKNYLKRGLDFRFFHATIKHFRPAKPRDTIKDMQNEWTILDIKYNYEEILEQKNGNYYNDISEEDQEDLDDDDEWDDDEDDWDEDEDDWDEDEEHSDGDSFSEISKAQLWIEYEACLIENAHNFKIGDSVKVKQGVMDYQTEKFDMSGWQGRIIDIDELVITPGMPFDQCVEIDFDSITLQQMPEKYIKYSLKRCRDIRCQQFFITEIEAALPRDTKAELIAARLELDKKYDYASILDLDLDEPEQLLYMDKEDFN